MQDVLAAPADHPPHPDTVDLRAVADEVVRFAVRAEVHSCCVVGDNRSLERLEEVSRQSGLFLGH
jgi:hypothetical protein